MCIRDSHIGIWAYPDHDFITQDAEAHVPARHEAKATKHLPLGHRGFHSYQVSDSFGQAFVEGMVREFMAQQRPWHKCRSGRGNYREREPFRATAPRLDPKSRTDDIE